MILETPSFKVTNIIFESYEHRSKIILQLLISFGGFAFPLIFRNLTAMDIENDQIFNSAEADAAVDSTYVILTIILIFLFSLGLCALVGSFINYDLRCVILKILDLMCPFFFK
jgi:hypothetical protein